MHYFFDLTLEELSAIVSPSFRAKQIYDWVYHKYCEDFSQMQNLPKAMKAELPHTVTFENSKIIKSEESKDGSVKYLFESHDGHTYEAVLLKMKDEQYHDDGVLAEQAKYTVCVSSQIGCKVGCSFCLTAKGGFVRNLSAGEIVHQIYAIKKANCFEANKRVNIVYMGMGEPLDNLDNVTRAIGILACDNGLAISTRRQTISTSGIAPKIEKLGKMNLGVQLAISLHAVDDDLREELIPMNKAYNIESIITVLKAFPIDSRKRVMFEYLVIKDINDDLKAAKKLLSLLNGIKSKVNLIYFNPYPGSPYGRPEKTKMVEFQEYLTRRGLLCTIRESKGLDISAACGQLREQALEGTS